ELGHERLHEDAECRADRGRREEGDEAGGRHEPGAGPAMHGGEARGSPHGPRVAERTMFARFLPMVARERRIRVVLLVLDGSVFFDMGTVIPVFGPNRPGTRRPDLGYDLVLATAVPGPVTTSAGVAVHVEAGLEARARADPLRPRG